ncbi:hypothetical protein L9F63_008918, partial [Diploptera punctata]
GRRGENIPQHFPRLPREKHEEYRDPPVGEEAKNIPQHFPRLPRERTRRISGSSMGEEAKTSHNIFPDSRGRNMNNIGILQWEKRRKHPTTFSPTPEGETSTISGSSKEAKTSHNIFPDSRGRNMNNIGILQEKLEQYRDPPWEKRRKHPTTFSPTPEGETRTQYRDPPVGEEAKTSHNISPTPEGETRTISESS